MNHLLYMYKNSYKLEHTGLGGGVVIGLVYACPICSTIHLLKLEFAILLKLNKIL